MTKLIGALRNACSAILESREAAIGSFFISFAIFLGISALFFPFLVGLSLGLLSVGLAFIAMHLSKKTDKKHTELLKILNDNIIGLRIDYQLDKLTPHKPPRKEQQEEILRELRSRWAMEDIVKEDRPIVKGWSERSKRAAQKRLDEDFQRVGYVRGEIYEIRDGQWGVNWGGKYPL